tara:strand:+ start:311 stop:625 length:315 start_codon:yes stop_codon:yes gene_type:complete
VKYNNLQKKLEVKKMNIEEMMKMQNGGLNIDADSLAVLKDVGTVTDEKVVVRMTSLKTNGSVWTKQYEGDINWNEIMPLLIEKFPHVIVSRQVIKTGPKPEVKE